MSKARVTVKATFDASPMLDSLRRAHDALDHERHLGCEECGVRAVHVRRGCENCGAPAHVALGRMDDQ